eukprot:gi/632944922/ref/XP_007887765.1/ PREDICTED: regulator of G-protein signaling 9-binding protein [Callorhinchus milii]
MVRDECKTLLDALNKVSACYRHLVVCVGGTSDSQNLREELRETRQKARVLAVANRNRLTAALKDRALGREDRAEFERLWVVFSTCVELLEVDMRRALELGHDFPLHVPRRHLIQSGLSGGTSAVAARAMSVRDMRYGGGSNIDTADLSDLEQEIDEVGDMLYQMEMKVGVPHWTVQTTRRRPQRNGGWNAGRTDGRTARPERASSRFPTRAPTRSRTA